MEIPSKLVQNPGLTGESFDRCVPVSRLETRFDAPFATVQSLREKQIQQNYRPVIGIHKWFARRPGTLFRALLLAEFGEGALAEEFWKGHRVNGVIADPFMGGGTTLYEASRLGFSVVGNDVNPMSHWLVERAFDPIDIEEFVSTASTIAESVDRELGRLCTTSCVTCGSAAHVKYFLWVKTAPCPNCGEETEAYPGFMLAENVRHPQYVVACSTCGELGEYEEKPTNETPGVCASCKGRVSVTGNYKRGQVTCRHCQTRFEYPPRGERQPPSHRLWAIEYQCEDCYPTRKGRQFKRPDDGDIERIETARSLLEVSSYQGLIPEDLIPLGDETARLHRWGYDKYREMFNERQLLFLTTLAGKISFVEDPGIRSALLTVFSDILRYNNMLCRYDTYALKCQDIFSVHGFPVGLIQCENSVIGKRGVGTGGFRHFVEKYARAKRYCENPFETFVEGRRKTLVYPTGERIKPEPQNGKFASLSFGPSQHVEVLESTLDGIFTDPPYFANVQYSELIDFCYVWLRKALGPETPAFSQESTRSYHEATGNVTAGRGVEAFTAALSDVYQRFCGGLKPGAPLVFTYHHNDPLSYMPLVVAVLDSGLKCTAVFPAAGEMAASMHIANTSSSILDSVFVCRGRAFAENAPNFTSHADLLAMLRDDVRQMLSAGVKVSRGDVRCLLAGRIAGLAINHLSKGWNRNESTAYKLSVAKQCVEEFISEQEFGNLVERILRGSDSH